MKIYKLNNPHGIYVDGDYVRIGKNEIDIFPNGLNLTYKDSDAIPFQYECETDTLFIGEKGGMHENMPKRLSHNIQEARVWLNSRILVSWFPFERNEIKSIINQFPYDIRGFYYLEFCERDDADYLVVFTIGEYNISPGSFYPNLESIYRNQQNPTANKTTNSGIDTKDFWRHYTVVGENKMMTKKEKAYIQQGGNYIEKMAREKELRRKKGLLHTERPTYKRDGSISNAANTVKISESQLRDMISESIKKILTVIK